MIYIGCDVHKKNTKVAWLDTQTGEVCKPYNVTTMKLAQDLDKFTQPVRIAIETSTAGMFVVRQLRSRDLDVLLVDAFKCQRLLEGRSRAKTDTLDAQGLAILLARGNLDDAAVGIADEQTVQLLQSIPGVGPLLAMTIVAEIGDITRFANAAKLRSYARLAPRLEQSGERTRLGPLMKHGNPLLCWALVQAAQHFARSVRSRNLRPTNSYLRTLFKWGPNPAKVNLALD